MSYQIPPGDWIEAAAAADLLGVTRRRVSALAKKGKLRSVLVVGRLLLDRPSVLSYRDSPDRKAGRPRSNPS